MAEYIERKEIIKAIAAEACHCLTLNRPAEARGYIGAKELIERRKAADVAEVRHGRWIVTDVVTCSECRHCWKVELLPQLRRSDEGEPARWMSTLTGQLCWHSIKWTDRGTRQDMYLCLWYARTSWTCPSPKSQPYGMATGKKPAMEMVSSALSAAVIFVLSPMRQSGFGVVLTAAL